MDWNEFKRVMGPIDLGAVAEYLGIAVLAPSLVYWLIRHHLSVDWDGGEGLLAGFLGLAGFVGLMIRQG